MRLMTRELGSQTLPIGLEFDRGVEPPSGSGHHALRRSSLRGKGRARRGHARRASLPNFHRMTPVGQALGAINQEQRFAVDSHVPRIAERAQLTACIIEHAGAAQRSVCTAASLPSSSRRIINLGRHRRYQRREAASGLVGSVVQGHQDGYEQEGHPSRSSQRGTKSSMT